MSDPLRAGLRDFASSIFAEMTALAQRTGALNLGQGFPDSDGPSELLEAARAAISAGRNQYPPLLGLPELRSAIARQRSERYGTAYDPDTEIQVTMGATEALAAAFLALTEPGDEVVVFEPYFDTYAANIAAAGARRVSVLLEFDGEYGGNDRHCGFDPDVLRAAITPRTRLLLLNSPHNPTGKVFDRAELEQIAEVCQEHDLIAITDEVYEYLTYDGVPHIPLATLPGMAERTLTISSAGKTFSVTGWKVGWICGPAELVAAVRVAKQFMTFSGGTPLQAAVAHGLQACIPWIGQLRDSLQHRRDVLAGALRGAGVQVYPAQGTYFMQVDAASFGFDDGEALCCELPER
ncbi:MAG: aminotransferase class I/II-fold pyridoxal phosphate-dependent enzyme, partial [Mycobacteriales bacterium]